MSTRRDGANNVGVWIKYFLRSKVADVIQSTLFLARPVITYNLLDVGGVYIIVCFCLLLVGVIWFASWN